MGTVPPLFLGGYRRITLFIYIYIYIEREREREMYVPNVMELIYGMK